MLKCFQAHTINLVMGIAEWNEAHHTHRYIFIRYDAMLTIQIKADKIKTPSSNRRRKGADTAVTTSQQRDFIGS